MTTHVRCVPTMLATQTMGSALATKLAAEIAIIDHELVDLDAQITKRFTRHESADVLLSLPGFGVVLAATFLANIGGNLDGFDTVDRLAAVAGLAPVPRDSGRISGNLHRPRRFNCRLLPSLLSRCAVESEEQSGIQGVLRSETTRRKIAQTSPHRAGSPPHQRHLGHAPRSHHLPETCASDPALLLLDNSIEIPNVLELFASQPPPAEC